MKRILFCLFALPFLLSACFAKPAPEITAELTVETTTAETTTMPEMRTDGLYDIDQSIDEAYLDSVGAHVLLKEVMPYSEYVERFDDGELTAIVADQLVWAVQIYFPRFDTIRGGVFGNAVTTSLYDAVTGFCYGYSVSGEEE